MGVLKERGKDTVKEIETRSQNKRDRAIRAVIRTKVLVGSFVELVSGVEKNI